MLQVRRKTGIRNGARPERKSIVMLGREHDILRAGVTENFCPGIWIPFLNLLIKQCGEVVVVAVGAVVLAVIRLRWRSIEPHAVEVPFRIWIVVNVVLRSKIVFGMYQWRPAGDRV